MPGEEATAGSMRVRKLLEEYPGLHMREVGRRLGIDVRAAKYHLDRLERSGYLTVLYFGRHKRYYPRRQKHAGELLDMKDKLLLGHLRNPISLGLVVHLVSFGPSRLVNLCKNVDVSPSKASFHLRKLERAGIVVRRTGAETRYDVEDAGNVRALLRVYRPVPDQVDGLLDLWDSFLGGE